MKQVDIIDKLKLDANNISSIRAMLLIGSFGRGLGTYNSDVDVSIIVEDTFKEELFINEIFMLFPNTIRKAISVELRNKCVFYFEKNTKLEFNICKGITDIDKYFLGSEILNYKDCILLDANGILEDHLRKIIEDKQEKIIDLEDVYLKTIDKFMYDFEQFSVYHKRSEAYKAYFQYNLALNDCLQLLQLNNRNTSFLYLPSGLDFFQGEDGNERLRKLNGTLHLSESNDLKRELLRLFYEIIERQRISNKVDLNVIKDFLEWIFLRDF